MLNYSDYQAHLISCIRFTALFLMLSTILGCNGDSSNNENTSKHSNNSVKVSVNLPDDSPLSGERLNIEIYGNRYPVNEGSQLVLNTSIEEPSDAYLMLPQRDGDNVPSVYLFSTLLPGETEAIIDPKETALSLVLNGIPQSLLLAVEGGSKVKATIEENSQAFIQNFVRHISSNPYYLNTDNLNTVYDSVYLQAVQESYRALQSLLSSQPGKARISSPSYRSITHQVPEGLDLYVTPENSHHGFKIEPIKEGNHVTGKVSISNDTSLYALLSAKDLVSNIDITPAVPDLIAEIAFNEHLLEPQQSFWGGFRSSESELDLMHRDAEVKIITAGVKDLTENEYIAGVSSALQLRTIYSKILVPSLDSLLDLGGFSIQKGVFGIMHNSGVFDAAIPAFYNGEITKGLRSVFAKLTENVNINGTPVWPNPVVNEILNYTLGQAIDTNSAYFAKIGLKLTAKKVTFAIWALDMTAVFNDLKLLPSDLSSNVRFPVDLSGIEPTAIERRNGNTIAHQEVVLRGYGFKTLQHTSGGYFPIVYVDGKNAEEETIDTLELFPPSSLDMSDDGTNMTFTIPGNWLNAESKITSMDVSLQHRYVARDELNRNILHNITLPLDVDKDKFTIDIGELTITALDKSRVQGSDTLTLTATGIKEQIDYYDVYLQAGSGLLVETNIESLSGTKLTVKLPHYDELEVGPASVYIQDGSGARSNSENLIIIPEKVTFLPGAPDVVGDIELGLTQAQGLPDIIYTINGGVERSYSAPIRIQNETRIKAWATQTVSGTDYSSEKVEYYHSVCEAGEALVDGQCLAACNRVCDNPSYSNTIVLPSDDDKHMIRMTFEKTFKYCTSKIDHPDFTAGQVTMIYFYTWESRTRSEWDEIRAANGGELPYYSPSLSNASNFNRGTLEIIGTHTDKQVHLTPQAVINPNDSTIKYYAPEDLFTMIVHNYDGPASTNKGDFMRVLIINDQNTYRETSLTVTNPEYVKENGCYEGDN